VSPCRTESVPVSSKTDLLLANAEPIRETGGTSIRMYLRKDKKLCTEKCERNNSADTKVSGEEGRGGAPGT